MTAPGRHVTCLGCGCVCDDLEVRVAGDRIAGIEPPCPLALRWFGDGAVPARVLAAGKQSSFDAAVERAADLLVSNRGRVLVYAGLDLSSQAQRTLVALADLLRGAVDGPTSETAAAGLLVAQRRGRASATLGEIRSRADVVLCWATDPAVRYPRWVERYAPPRPGRMLVGVSVGRDAGPASAEVRVSLGPEQELAALSVLRAVALGRQLDGLSGALADIARLGARLVEARYVAIVHDAEPGAEPDRDVHRTEGLVALAQALNGPTRAALSGLRGGGNRSGLESVLTWQTGFPMAVEFSSGAPRYVPADRGAAVPGSGRFGAALVAGSAGELDRAALTGVPAVIVGPRASEAGSAAAVAIDTGVAGIHEPGIAYRMDEVPLPLTPPLSGPRLARDVLDTLLAVVHRRLGELR